MILSESIFRRVPICRPSRVLGGLADTSHCAEDVPKPGEQILKRNIRLRFGWAVLALIVVGACLLTYRYFYGRALTTKSRPSIAVLGFKDITRAQGANEWLSTALSEMLSMDLSEGGQVRTVPVDTVAEIKRDLRLVDSDGLARAALNRVRGRAGADWVAVGAYAAFGDPGHGRLRLDVRVQDTRSGETVTTISETGSERNLFEFVDGVAVRLRQALGLPAIAGERSELAVLTSDPGAMRLYSEGLDRLRESNAVAARNVLERAVQADPSNPFAHSALAAAWDALGYEEKAQESARRAYQLASHLSRLEQLQIEARFRSYAHQWNEAIRIYRTLCRMEPDSVDDALMLVQTERLASKLRDALSRIESLRKVGPQFRNDPRIDFAEAKVLGDLGDFGRAREYAALTEHKASVLGMRLLYAKAKLFESGAMQNLGMTQASAVRAEARRLCTDLSDRACVLQALPHRGESNFALVTCACKGIV